MLVEMFAISKTLVSFVSYDDGKLDGQNIQ
jgi:hypothetical protein